MTSSFLRVVFVAVAIVGAIVVDGCNCGPNGPCTTDAQCDATGEGYSKCNVKEGTCVCTDNRGCGDNEFCNPVGNCQAIEGCTTNDDCGGEGFFCDTQTSNCLSVAECNPGEGETCCTQDAECPFRSICDRLILKCVEGCRDNGDCVLGEGCVGATLSQTGICGRACTADNLCAPGELCNLQENICEIDTRGPYCLGCTGGVSSDDCGDYGNYCLLDQVNVGASYCGVDCSGGQECPNGYECHQVIILPPSAPQCGAETCDNTGHCTTNTNVTCTDDEDCPIGPPYGTCPQETGRYGNCELSPLTDCFEDADCPEGACIPKKCVGGEGDNLGHCSCTRDSDCPTDTCKDADLSDPDNPVAGHCELSGHACLSNVECDVITCVDGGCYIGDNCAPANDRSCGDLLTPTP